MDEKIGQLIALKHGKIPRNPNHRMLRIVHRGNLGAVTNLNIDGAVWRWVRAYHSALYREPLPVSSKKGITTPFPRARLTDGPPVVEELLPQHALFVKTIKLNRAAENIDRVRSNRRHVTYDCVWCESENAQGWFCVFALDVYRWKELGNTGQHPPRGCVGFYQLPSGEKPQAAAVAMAPTLEYVDAHPFDPFAPSTDPLAPD
jgi:hypothetical protein